MGALVLLGDRLHRPKPNWFISDISEMEEKHEEIVYGILMLEKGTTGSSEK